MQMVDFLYVNRNVKTRDWRLEISPEVSNPDSYRGGKFVPIAKGRSGD